MGFLVITILASLAILALIGIKGSHDRNAWLSRKAESPDAQSQKKKPPVRLFSPPAYSGRGYDLAKRSLDQYDAETQKAMIEAEAKTKAPTANDPKTSQGTAPETAPKIANTAAKFPVRPRKTFGRRRHPPASPH